MRYGGCQYGTAASLLSLPSMSNHVLVFRICLREASAADAVDETAVVGALRGAARRLLRRHADHSRDPRRAAYPAADASLKSHGQKTSFAHLPEYFAVTRA